MFTAVVAAGLLSSSAPAGCRPAYTLDQLVRMDRCQLEALYRSAEVGCAPTGVTNGRAIRNPGSRLTVPTSRVVHVLWQGKVFKDDGMMVNRVLGVRAVHARVYPGESWLDGRPSVVMDYAGASKLFPDVRDEVREVSPGVWLGVMYTRKPTGPEQTMFFALQARR
jgi:hypothetical protein